MTNVGIHLIFGSNPEPFLEAALRSVEWADYVCAVNTAPTDSTAEANERIVREAVEPGKLRMGWCDMPDMFDFAKARNMALGLADDYDYVMILDSDDVHYPEWEEITRRAMRQQYDIITAHFWHLIGYKNLWGEEPHREILFNKTPATHFTKAVHEGLYHPRTTPWLADNYHYVHYGYVKPPSEIFKRWVLYSQIEGDPHHYDGRNPDDALAGWLDNTQPFWREHPPAAQKTLESYPSAPKSARALGETPCNVGLVMLTWNDAKNLEACLKSLATTRQPFKLCVVDNGSTDESSDLIKQFSVDAIENHADHNTLIIRNNGKSESLARSLNRGFGYFMDDPDIDYVGWIHPDMVFERDTWLECLRYCLDTHPDIAKVGATEMDSIKPSEPTPGNSQCYLIRKTVLERVGLFDERFEACGGYEDWEHNCRILKEGRVMIWPDALIRHNAMGTRKYHDNADAGRRNADLYHSIVGTWDPPC